MTAVDNWRREEILSGFLEGRLARNKKEEPLVFASISQLRPIDFNKADVIRPEFET